MQNVDEFGSKLFDSRSVFNLALLVPTVLWWTALVLSLTVAKGLAEFLGNSIFQVIVLVACPISAFFMGFMTAKNSKLRWLIVAAGVFFAAVALLASFRSS